MHWLLAALSDPAGVAPRCRRSWRPGISHIRSVETIAIIEPEQLAAFKPNVVI
jgi:hypothetical protein